MRNAVLLVLLASVPACTGWAQRAGDPTEILREERHQRIVVGTVDGREIVLRSPNVEAGRLVGTAIESRRRTGGASGPVEIPLDEVAWIGTRVEDSVQRSKAVASIVTLMAFLAPFFLPRF